MTSMLQGWLRLDVWRRGADRELLRLGIALVLGCVIVPALIWWVGKLILGPYAHGGLLALWGDFFAGLAHASFPFWLVALGPYALLWLLRLWLALLRS
ncbi:MAG TPA: hypothetical protein VMI92_09640 [Steroidobacteraceae bacterium]|nr:hypothetical protein [Steroidobacteraceae bacterium]